MPTFRRLGLSFLLILTACPGCASRRVHSQAPTGYTPDGTPDGGFLQSLLQGVATDSSNGWNFHKDGW